MTNPGCLWAWVQGDGVQCVNRTGLWSRDAVERQMSHQERNGYVLLTFIKQNIWKNAD